jgi:hypothetical protein
MAMAVQVDDTLSYAIPGPKGIMTEHKGSAVDCYLRIGLHAHPVKVQHCRRVVISNDEVLSPIQKRKYFGCDFSVSGEVPKMPNLVFGAYNGVPPLGHSRVHLVDRTERAFRDIQNPMISEMGVGGEENGHVSSLQLRGAGTQSLMDRERSHMLRSAGSLIASPWWSYATALRSRKSG